MPKKDYISEIGEYVKKNLKKGYTKESLKWALINQGYSRMEVEKAMGAVDIELGKQAPALDSKPVIKYEVQPLLEDEPKSFWKRIFGI